MRSFGSYSNACSVLEWKLELFEQPVGIRKRFFFRRFADGVGR